MSTFRRSLSLALLFTAATLVGACGGAVDGSADGEGGTDEGPQPPAIPTFSSEGLTLESNGPDQAAGTFERKGASIHFLVEGDRARGVRHAVITRLDGQPLFESTLRDGVDTSTYLGGRVTTTGPMGEQPAISGDASALDTLTAMAESTAMIELKTALEAAGVSVELLRGREDLHVTGASAGEGAIRPNVYGAGGNTPYPDNTWRLLTTNQAVGFYSWGFWATTAVVIQGVDGYHVARFRVGSTFATEYVSGTGQVRYYRQWWGAYADVTNVRIQLCGVTAPIYCDNPQAWVLVK